MFEVRLARAMSKTVGGGTPERDNPEFWNGGIPWASVKDFPSSGESVGGSNSGGTTSA